MQCNDPHHAEKGRQMTRAGIAIGAIQTIVVVGVIALALILSNALRTEPAERSTTVTAQTALPVTVVKPVTAPFTGQIVLNGVVEARTQASIAPQVSGNVTAVGSVFRSGARFQRGDLFFQIDPSDFELALEQADAEIAATASDLMLLEADAEIAIREWRELFPGEEPTDLAASRPQIAAAKARVRSAEASRKAAELALQRTTVRAPFDGRVLETQLEVGQYVTPQVGVGQIFPTDAVEVSAAVSSSELKRLGDVTGKTAQILTGASSEAMAGIVDRTDSSLDPRTRLATLRIKPADPDTLTLGDYATVRLEGETLDRTVILPASALVSRDSVWVVSAERLSSRQVEVVAERGDTIVAMAFDVADGVVSIPPVAAREGLPVTISGVTEGMGVRNVSVDR